VTLRVSSPVWLHRFVNTTTRFAFRHSLFAWVILLAMLVPGLVSITFRSLAPSEIIRLDCRENVTPSGWQSV